MSIAYLKLFYDTEDSVALLDDAEAGRLLKAVLAYGRRGEKIVLTGEARLIFPTIKNQIDRDSGAYEAMCERNKANIRKRYEPHRDATTRNDSLPVVTTGYQDKDKDKDEDKEKDQDKDKDPPKRDPAVAYAVDNLRAMSYGNLEELVSFKNDLPDDVIMHAIDIATANGKPTFAYVRAILMRYANEGIRSMGDVKAKEDARCAAGSTKYNGKPNPALDYQRSEIPDDIFGADFFVNLDGGEKGAKA